MKPASDIEYYLDFDGERVPLDEHMTLGRHLENDLVLSGEDVLDFHVRLEMTDRGPRAIPLGEASLRVGGRDYSAPVGLMPGDILEIGPYRLQLALELRDPPEADEWRLHQSGDAAGRPLTALVRVGRSAGNDLQLLDDHVSRFHAHVAHWGGTVWVRDLGSANGTFVNGERVGSAARLFHGDEVRFDTHSFQLIGRGADLTPVSPSNLAGLAVPFQAPPGVRGRVDGDTIELLAVNVADDHPSLAGSVAPAGASGTFLLGVSETVAGEVFRPPIGRSLVGRDEDCDLVLLDRTVSARHAELIVRAEGVTVTDLMATNRTRVNGVEVRSARLRDGDVLRLGRICLVFKDAAPAAAGRRSWRPVGLALLGGAALIAALIALTG